MALTSLIPTWLKRLITRPVGELTRWQRTARWGIDLARHCAAELRHDKARQMAAALTYHTLFSLLPTVVLMLVILKGFLGPDERKAFQDATINWTIHVVQSDAPPVVPIVDPEAAPPDGVLDPDAEDRRQEFEAFRQSLETKAGEIFAYLENVRFGGIGAVGVLVFIFAATALLGTVEKSFNAVFGVSHSRPWYIRLPLYYTVITLAPIVIVAALFMQNRMFGVLQAGAWTNWLVAPAGVILPILATWAVLFGLYYLMPSADVTRRSAAIGGLVAAILWLITEQLFGLYLSNAAITTLYGALAALPIFLLWLYLSWLVILFGLELTYALQAMARQRFKHMANKQQDDQIIDPAWSIPLAGHIARAFSRGEVCGVEELSHNMNLHPRAVRKMLTALEEAEVVHHVQDRRHNGYSLARPARAIEIRSIFDVVRRLLPPQAEADRRDAAWELVDEVQEAGDRVAEHKTLADVCAEEESATDEAHAMAEPTEADDTADVAGRLSPPAL